MNERFREPNTREELFSYLPWHARALWWAFTGPSIVYMFLHLGIAICNPFWFRQSHLQWVQDHTHYLGQLRDRLLRPVYDKWLMLARIKG